MFKDFFKTEKRKPENSDDSLRSVVQPAYGLSNLYAPTDDSVPETRDVADVLAEMGKITSQQLTQVRKTQQKNIGMEVSQILKDLHLAGPEEILMARANLYGFEFRRIEPEDVTKETFEKLELSYIKNNHIMPISVNNNTLVVATSQPANVFAIDDVKRQTGMNVEVVVCIDDDIAKVAEALTESTFDYSLDDIIKDISHGDLEFVQAQEQEEEDLEKIAGESPIINFVNYLISNAIHEGASDIHVEAKEKKSKIRLRIDGVLFDSMEIPGEMHPAVVSRLKIMSNLDISERRVPQDGRIAVIVGRKNIDLRVSSLPTSHGEKVVIRILDGSSILLGLEELGMAEETLNLFREQIHSPNGIILVTGPTGSGKTTTLYSGLNQMDGVKLNISTVEDPVEYQLAFCNQVQVNEKAGLTFATALRSLLRQDPDVIMVGEIRDSETARISVQAALTGHLVLSTLHTNDAPSSITRLVDIGIEPYLISASLNSVMAQRLVRKICPNCRQRLKMSKEVREQISKVGIKPEEVFHGSGCDKCRGSGYSGRVGIYEFLVINDTFRDMIIKDSSINNMRRAFATGGGRSLYDDGMSKVRQGLTTIEEVLRVTESHNSEQKTEISEH
jgi:type IV pilus assembly protein PilB